MRVDSRSLWAFGGKLYEYTSPVTATEAWVAGVCSFERLVSDEKGRFDGRASVGTRNAGTEYEAAIPRLDGRNACIRALRKHVCAVLIEGWRDGREGE